MLACPAVILLQAICVHVAAQPLPFFYGYMKEQLYGSQYDSIKFNMIGETNFNESRTAGYSQFPMTEKGIYWISLRPMEWCEYHVRVNEVIVASAESGRQRKSAVGFARFLNEGDVVRVTRNIFRQSESQGRLKLSSYFSIVLVKRTSEEHAANSFWTAKYYTHPIDAQPTKFSYHTGLDIDRTQENRRMCSSFRVPWTGLYWVSLRAVPDGTVDFIDYTFQVNGCNVFVAWTKFNLGAYASRVVFLRANHIVTVNSIFRTSNMTSRIGLLEDSMVSVVPLPPGNHVFFGKHWSPIPQEPWSVIPNIWRRDVSEPMLPSFAERQTASDSKVRALLEPRLSDNDIRQQYDFDTTRLVRFSNIHYDPLGLMRRRNTTLIIQQSGLYLISLRNDPEPIPEGKQSTMVMYFERRGTSGNIILSAVAYPPTYIAVPQGMDCAYFLNAGDTLHVIQLDDRGTDYETMWSLVRI